MLILCEQKHGFQLQMRHWAFGWKERRTGSCNIHTVSTKLKPSAQRNATETNQFRNSFRTVLKVFCFSFISLRGRFEGKARKQRHLPPVTHWHSCTVILCFFYEHTV